LILYTLHCAEGHEFQSWFRDSAAYDAQIEQGLVVCPHCHSARVSKSIMAPSILRSGRKRADSSQVEAAPGSKREVAFLDEQHAALRAMIRELREKIMAATVDVGERFPDEARRIQEGEVEQYAIRGRATLEEAKALLEEGIEIFPLPGPPGEGN
jgi:hypothetical protein